MPFDDEVKRLERRNKGLKVKDVSPEQRAIEDALASVAVSESHTIEAPSLRSMAADLGITAPNFSTAEFSKQFNFVGRAQAQGWTEEARAELAKPAIQPGEALEDSTLATLPTANDSEHVEEEHEKYRNN